MMAINAILLIEIAKNIQGKMTKLANNLSLKEKIQFVFMMKHKKNVLKLIKNVEIRLLKKQHAKNSVQYMIIHLIVFIITLLIIR